MAIMRNVSVPFGAPYAEFGVYNTEYRTVIDLKDKLYLFELSTSPNVIWVDFDQLKLTDRSGPLEINPYDSTPGRRRHGPISAQFGAVLAFVPPLLGTFRAKYSHFTGGRLAPWRAG